MFANDEKNDWGKREKPQVGDNLTLRPNYQYDSLISKILMEMEMKKEMKRNARIERRRLRREAKENK